MRFVNYLKDLQGTIAIFVDMDGVIADYDNDPNYNKYESGFYLKKRPILTIINILKEASKLQNVTFYLLSGHSDEDDLRKLEEKNLWVNKYVPFIKPENRIFNSPKIIDSKSYRAGKSISIEKLIENINYDNVIQIDDDVRVIKGTNRNLGGKVIMLHVISILD